MLKYLFSQIKTAKVAAKGAPPVKKVRLGRPGTSLKMGLLGMANIGKSSTFNLLTKMNVPAENRPFCTIEPNTAFIHPPDPRFEKLVQLFKPANETPVVLRILDIAGLVKGASEGYGLGNQFLTHVMQTDGLYHVVRAFEGEEISHTEGSMDPARDVNIIRNELIAKDRDVLQKKMRQFGRKASKSQDKTLRQQYDVICKALDGLKSSKQVRYMDWNIREVQFLNKYLLLTSKPMIYLINLSKEDFLANKIPSQQSLKSAITYDGKHPDTTIIPFSVEYQQQEDKKQLSQVNNIIKAGFEQLELIYFYTVGTDEVRAWPIRNGQTAIEAGGKIHSDFTRGFISAEVLHSDLLLKNPEWKDKLAKHCKKEGKTYVVREGDIVHFNTKLK